MPETDARELDLALRGPPEGERSRTGTGVLPAVHSPGPSPGPPGTVPAAPVGPVAGAAVRRYLDYLAVAGARLQHPQRLLPDLRRYAGWLAAAGIDDLAQAGSPTWSPSGRAPGRQHPGRHPLPGSSVARPWPRCAASTASWSASGWPAPTLTRLARQGPGQPPQGPLGRAGRGTAGGDAGHDQLALRDRALLETLYAAGLRVSEATALDVDDLDLEDGRCGVRQVERSGWS